MKKNFVAFDLNDLSEVIVRSGGYTDFSIHSGRFIVGVRNVAEFKGVKKDIDDVFDCLKILNEKYCFRDLWSFGYWLDGDILYVDKITSTNDLLEAVELAVKYGQQAIFDVQTEKVLRIDANVKKAIKDYQVEKTLFDFYSTNVEKALNIISDISKKDISEELKEKIIKLFMEIKGKNQLEAKKCSKTMYDLRVGIEKYLYKNV